MKLVQMSENTVVVLMEQVISADVSRKVNELSHYIDNWCSEVLVDIIPSYASIHFLFDLRKTTVQEFMQVVQGIIEQPQLWCSDDELSLKEHNSASAASEKIVDIPVYYGLEVALDLPVVADKVNMTNEKVVQIHTATIYQVYALGFAPGFAYMGNVDPSIAMPRKTTPRLQVPKGSLGIANEQTAIYPNDSPGGWQIIGRTPTAMLNFESSKPSLLSVGDKVRFVPIDVEQYIELGGKF